MQIDMEMDNAVRIWLDAAAAHIKEIIATVNNMNENIGGKIDNLGGKIDSVSSKVDKIGEKIDLMIPKEDQMLHRQDELLVEVKDMNRSLKTKSIMHWKIKMLQFLRAIWRR